MRGLRAVLLTTEECTTANVCATLYCLPNYSDGVAKPLPENHTAYESMTETKSGFKDAPPTRKPSISA